VGVWVCGEEEEKGRKGKPLALALHTHTLLHTTWQLARY
jgi:hypothetical protein